MSQTEFAALLGVHPITISKWERGKTRPTAHQIAVMHTIRYGDINGIGEPSTYMLTAGVPATLGYLLWTGSEKIKRSA